MQSKLTGFIQNRRHSWGRTPLPEDNCCHSKSRFYRLWTEPAPSWPEAPQQQASVPAEAVPAGAVRGPVRPVLRVRAEQAYLHPAYLDSKVLFRKRYRLPVRTRLPSRIRGRLARQLSRQRLSGPAWQGIGRMCRRTCHRTRRPSRSWDMSRRCRLVRLPPRVLLSWRHDRTWGRFRHCILS